MVLIAQEFQLLRWLTKHSKSLQSFWPRTVLNDETDELMAKAARAAVSIEFGGRKGFLFPTKTMMLPWNSWSLAGSKSAFSVIWSLWFPLQTGLLVLRFLLSGGISRTQDFNWNLGTLCPPTLSPFISAPWNTRFRGLSPTWYFHLPISASQASYRVICMDSQAVDTFPFETGRHLSSSPARFQSSLRHFASNHIFRMMELHSWNSGMMLFLWNSRGIPINLHLQLFLNKNSSTYNNHNMTACWHA